MEDKPFKIVIVGDSSVGKTSIISSFIHGRYNQINDATVGVSFYLYKSDKLKLHIWDTAGQERFRSLVPMYVRDSHIVIAVFDGTNMSSYYDLIQNWIPFIRKVDDQVPIIIVESKIEATDAGRFTEIAQEYAKDNSFSFWRVSAKKGININELLDDAISQLKTKKAEKKILLNIIKEPKSGYCC
jgi:small GTP-binding protein